MSGFLVLSAYKVLENDCDKSLIHRQYIILFTYLLERKKKKNR